MNEQQCRSCGIVKPLDGFGKYTNTNGHVRGLLCGTCNRGVGMFKDDVQMLQSAIKYLQGDINGS